MAEIYSIKVYNNDTENAVSRFFSFRSTNGRCHQMCVNQQSSKWQLINACDPKRKSYFYYIQNKPNRKDDQQNAKFLSFDAKTKRLGVYTGNQRKSVWKLVSVAGDVTISRIACFHNGCYQGWIGVDDKGEWNKLVDDIDDAVIYHLKRY